MAEKRKRQAAEADELARRSLALKSGFVLEEALETAEKRQTSKVELVESLDSVLGSIDTLGEPLVDAAAVEEKQPTSEQQNVGLLD